MNVFVKILRFLPHQLLGILAILGLIIGLVTSKVLMSVATITLLGNALLNVNVRSNLKQWLNDKTSMVLLAMFLIYVLSGFYSSDLTYWFDRCKTKLPFIALPLGFLTLKIYQKKTYLKILSVFVITNLIAALIVFSNYLIHFDSFNQLISTGKSIPAPLNDHIRFSLEMAFAIFCSFHLYKRNFYFIYVWEKYCYLFASVLLIIILHFFAVRSGLIAFYGGLSIWIFVLMFTQKKITTSIILFLAMIGIFIVAVSSIPSLKHKIDYFNYEWQLIVNGEIKEGHSDAQRFLSIRNGLLLGHEHPILGVGVGDIKQEMEVIYLNNAATKHLSPILPHNQFVFIYASLGSIGVLFFLASFLFPLFTKRRHTQVLFLVFNGIVLLSFLTEYMLEIQIGMAFYLVFLLLLIHENDNPFLIHTNA